MKIKKLFKHKNKNQIWRLLLSDTDKLIIEARNGDTKEAFFSVFEVESGKTIIKDYQFEEKFWLGIDKIYKDVIFLHKFAKPDMPIHKSIIAFDTNSQKVIWEHEQLTFRFVTDNKVYVSMQSMMGDKYYALDYKTGESVTGKEIDQLDVLELLNQAESEVDNSNYKFPEIFSNIDNYPFIQNSINKIVKNNNIEGSIEFIGLNRIVLFNFHFRNKRGQLNNQFLVVDIEKEKVIFDEVLNSDLNAAVPDSFFIYKNFVFLLKDKDSVIVCELI